jgi:beta-galactosidase
MAFDQFKLPAGTPAVPAVAPAGAKLVLTDAADAITVAGPAITARFDRARGTLASLKYRDTELVHTPLMPDFWRAWTDNDRGARLQARLHVWRVASESWDVRSVTAAQVGGGAVRVEVDAAIPVISSGYTVTYTIFPSGDIYVDASFTPGIETLPMLPRFGMQMAMPAGFEQITWLGPGPEETYADRNEARVGCYSGTVDAQWTEYSKPQENGKTRCLGCCRQETCHGGGRAFVHIRCPEVERNDRNLKGQAHQDQGKHTECPHDRQAAGLQHARQLIDITRPGKAEDQAETVEHDR